MCVVLCCVVLELLSLNYPTLFPDLNGTNRLPVISESMYRANMEDSEGRRPRDKPSNEKQLSREHISCVQGEGDEQ